MIIPLVNMLIRRVSYILITQFVCVLSARNRSLTFVIDDTLSMQDDINQVLNASYNILDIVTSKQESEVGNYVLVTFNDPKAQLREQTFDKNPFLSALRNTVVHNRENYDCPENALTGIIKALKVSSPESFLYVFTDSSAKDYDKLNQVKMMCERKQSRVVIILTGDCVGYVGEELGSLSVFYKIARACNGLVIEGNKYDVKDFVDAIVPDAVSDQKSIITSKVIPVSSSFEPVEFTVDDKTEYVTIQASGRNVQLSLKNNNDNAVFVEKMLWKKHVKMVKFHPRQTGKYYAWVRGSTDVTIVVYAATDFTFDHGFSEFVPKSLTDASKQPIANRPHYLSISVTDPEQTVSIKSAEILDMNEKVLESMVLKKARGDFYITEKFISPQDMFKVQVTGIVKETGREIKRISKTAIEPQMPPPPASKALVATITDGSSVDVDYDGSIELTCKVSGYPTPMIQWTTADGITLSEKSNVVELPYDYISYLKLANVRNRGTYYCRAHNNETLEDASVVVNPRSPFIIQTPLPSSVKAKYGEEKQIRCDISSKFPFVIKWNVPSRSVDYTLSASKKVMTIKSVDLFAQGLYLCQASLKHDRNQKHVIKTKLLISDLSPPIIIDPATEKTTVLYGGKAHIKCKISGGIPRPSINWTVKKSSNTQYRELPVVDEEITLDSATLGDAGIYHCTARNSEGYASKTTELIVQMKPTTIIEEGSNLAVSYGNNLKITCKVIAIPVPKHIEWRNSKGEILTSQMTINNNEITSRLSIPHVKVPDSFTCYSENSVGTSASRIHVEITSPFVIQAQPKGVTPAMFGSKTDISCDVKSDFPMRVRWFFKSSAGVAEVLSSGNYKISAAGTTLTILNTNMDAVGTYSCEASLVNDGEQKVAFATDVQIVNLTPPVLLNTQPKVITVKQNQNVRISCTIVAGVPPPDLIWHVMKKGETSFTKVPGTGNELTSDGVVLADAGVYQCTAKNERGQDVQKTELIVQSIPELSIDEGAKIATAYGSLVNMTCKIIAFPLPTVEWRNSKGIRLPSEEIKSNYEVTNRLTIPQVKSSDTYTCFAENAVGKSAKSIDVQMMAPFVVRVQPKGVTSAKYGSKTDITCDVRSDFPMRVRWFFKSNAGVAEVLSSGIYKISAAGTTLTILNTNMDAVGTYSCEVSLVNDDEQKVAFATDVQIVNLTPPVLLNTHPKVITVKQNQNVRIPCTIVAGVPPPDLIWHVMKKSETSFTKMPGTGNELTSNGVVLADAGVYQCTAKNVKGQTEQKTELIVQSLPEITIEEGSKIVTSYGSMVNLTCNIIAFPLPTVGWRNSKGNRLPSEVKKSIYEVTSRLSIPQVKSPDKYTCFAENALGESAKSIDLQMMAPFVVRAQPKGVTSAMFGSKTDISCDVKSDFPMRVRWFFKSSAGVAEVLSSGNYKISAAGTTLTILNTNMDAVGTYSCEASLVNDGEQKVAFATDVQIVNLTPPVLLNTHPKVITVKQNQNVRIPCTIVAGVPPPDVIWHVMKKGETSFIKLSASGNELVINGAALADAGVYQCTAENVKGQTEQKTELIVQSHPELSIEEGSKIATAYGSMVHMTCKIIAFPLPTVGWRNSKGIRLPSEDEKSNYEVTSRLTIPQAKSSDTYTCFAENAVGKSAKSIDVQMMTPFVIRAQPKGVTSAMFGSKTDISCDVKSDFPMRVRWFFKSNAGVAEVLSSGNYKISAAGTTLTILNTNMDAVGTYSCEVSLVNDDEQKVAFATDVQIVNLTPPVLLNTHPKVITVKQNQNVRIPCTIVAGVPPPDLIWHVMKKGKTSFTKMPGTGNELTSDGVVLADAGVYRCTAKNVKGQTEHKTELIVQSLPEITIEEGSKIVTSYGSMVNLTCNIIAFPLPTVGWRNSKGNRLPSELKKSIYEVKSRLTIPQVKSPDTYTCFAENALGESAKSFDLQMMAPFMVRAQPKGVTSAMFGSKTDISCDVKSDFPMRVRWFFKNSAGVAEVLSSGNYKISAAGTTLSILYTNMDTVGTYSCEASLVNDDEQKVAFATDVQIVNLTPPVLLNTHPKVITIKQNQNVRIPCTIVAGVPPPDVIWHVMKKGETSFTKLPASGNELVISGAALADAGMYQCTAKNMMGQAKQTTELVVEMEPDVFIIEGKSATVPYNSEKEFTCKAVGYPLPEIEWKDSKGLSVKNNINVINKEVISRLTLNNIKSPDTYTCYATNKLGQKMSSVRVHVLPSIDFATFPPETISVKYEEPTVIRCDAKSSMPMTIKWFYQKEEHSRKSEIVSSENYNISSDKHVLRIVSTLLDDIGKYTCEASLIDDERETKSYTANVEISNLKVPEIVFSNNSITIQKGENMSASCIADGIPKPKITWQFKTKLSNEFTSLPYEGEWISISDMGYDDAGLYKCIATNALDTQTQSIDVVVDGIPKIINSDSVYYGVTGDKKLKIPCEVEGVPTPEITWKHRGKVVISDKKLLVGINALYIQNPTEKDSNNFTCEAKNKYGYDEKTFEADISDFITYNEEYNSNIYLKLGEATDIKCMLPHSDPKSVRWYVNGEKADVSGTYYSIKNAQYSNDGNYTCRLNTEEGSQSLNYVVDVGYKPSFKALVPTNIDWYGNKEDTLDCDVYAKPSAKVEWTYNGVTVDGKWPELGIFDWGQYSCRASNVHDSVQRTFNVSSSDCVINRTAVDTNRIPLFIDDEANTWPSLATTNEFYSLSPDELISLECATLDQPDNTFQILPSQRIKAKCYKEDKFLVGGKIFKFNELQCKAHVKPSQVITEKGCMDNGKVVEIGFKLAQGFLKAFEVCYNKVDHNTIYSKEVMSSVNNGNIVTPSFRRGTKDGDHGELKKCAYNTHLLVKPENVAFGPAQTATTLFDQYNTVLVFEPCEDSSRMSWNDVENAVKTTLYSYDQITVYTGASQRDSNGTPRYLWKVVMFDDDTFETIVYVNVANPSSGDVLCPKTESDRFSDVTSFGDEYTYVCSMDEFSKAFAPLSDFTDLVV